MSLCIDDLYLQLEFRNCAGATHSVQSFTCKIYAFEEDDKLSKLMRRTIAVLMTLTIVLPIPGIFVVSATGLSMLICSSLRFALFLQAVRRKFPLFNRAMLWLESKMGDKLSKNLRITRLEDDPREHFSR